MNKLTNWVIKKYKLILILSLVVFGLSVLGASRLEVLSNMENMLSADSEVLKAGNEFDQYFDSQENALVVVKGEGMLCEAFLKDLETEMKAAGVAGSILYRVNKNELREYGLLYLDRDFHENLEKAMDAQDLKAVESTLAGMETLNAGEEEYEYLTNEERNAYMMVVKPVLDKVDFVGSRQRFYDGMKAAIADTLALPKYQNLEAGLTGGAFIQDIEADTVAFEGFGSTFAITLLLIILLIIFSFRRILLPLSVTYPLILGTLTAAAVAWVIYGNLNMFSVSFALLLIGLGIDFAIHLISRYYEEREKDISVQSAATTALKHSGAGILIGALTTAVAFLAFVVARFKAFAQMGVISSIGIIVLCVFMLLIVPALMQIIDVRRQVKAAVKKSSFYFLNTLGESIAKRPWLVIVILAALIPALYFSVSNTSIIGDIDKIYPDNMDSKAWEAVVVEEFDYNPNVLTFMVDDEEALKACIEDLNKKEGIDTVSSGLDYLPSDQDYKLGVLHRLEALLKSISHPAADRFAVEKMSISDLPETIKSNYVGREGRLLVEVIPSVNVYQQKNYEMVKDAILDASGRLPVGMPAIMNEIVAMVQKDIVLICLICFVAILAFLLLAFRSLKATILCILPVMLTLYITLGILPLIGREINIFSVAAFPLIIGIGVDSSIHLMHRLKSKTTESIGYVIMHTGKAILLTSLTTLLGFGSLAFINHPGMSNLGATVALGMLICLIVTLLFIPAAFTLTYRNAGDRAG